jgi:hypothetical protein
MMTYLHQISPFLSSTRFLKFFIIDSSFLLYPRVTALLPTAPGAPSPLAPQERDWDLLLTAETHNFPCAVAPYPGAETGAGGRIRDTHATGKKTLSTYLLA